MGLNPQIQHTADFIVVFTFGEKICALVGPARFKPKLFKGQPYLIYFTGHCED